MNYESQLKVQSICDTKKLRQTDKHWNYQILFVTNQIQFISFDTNVASVAVVDDGWSVDFTIAKQFWAV